MSGGPSWRQVPMKDVEVVVEPLAVWHGDRSRRGSCRHDEYSEIMFPGSPVMVSLVTTPPSPAAIR
jgi:hypothetical protein